MPIQNDFLTFAAASDANVLTQAEYAAASATDTGYVQGVASSAAVNKTLRQTTLMAAVIAQFIVDNTGEDAIDDGTTSALLSNLKKATSGRLLNIQVFTVSGTYTPTAGTKSVDVELAGGGGGSAATIATGSTTVCSASGGGGGAYAKGRFTSGFSGVTITVGAGGTGAPAGNSVGGGNGGTTSFGALLSASGGFGGPISSSQSTSTTGTSLRTGGGNTITGTAYYSAPGGASSYGPCLATKISGGDGGACGNGAPGMRGAATVGSGGAPGAAAVALGSGAGGGSASTTTISQAGANGANGFVIVREYA